MIEAALMGGSLPGPWSPWEFVGASSFLASGSIVVEGKFPNGLQTGDLVVAVVSPRDESVRTTMAAPGWQHWATGIQDYVCTARYAHGLPAPRWTRGGENAVYVCVLAFRAQGWTDVRLEAHVAPAAPQSITTHLQNELLLCIGLTPSTTRGWDIGMKGAIPAVRAERELSPAMQIYSANVDYPHEVSGVSIDAVSGRERNLILTAY